MVMQEPFLFSNTIEENVRFGAEGVAEAEIKKALADAAADDFIVELPEGSATVIGERGIGLSGGEKQRLTIARALVKKGKILILTTPPPTWIWRPNTGSRRRWPRRATDEDHHCPPDLCGQGCR